MKTLLKIVLILALLGGVGFLVFNYHLADSSSGACGRIASLCKTKSENAEAKCEIAFQRLEAVGGKNVIKRTNRCIEESKSCAAAFGCFVGGVGSTLKSKGADFLDGLKRSLE